MHPGYQLAYFLSTHLLQISILRKTGDIINSIFGCNHNGLHNDIKISSVTFVPWIQFVKCFTNETFQFKFHNSLKSCFGQCWLSMYSLDPKSIMAAVHSFNIYNTRLYWNWSNSWSFLSIIGTCVQFHCPESSGDSKINTSTCNNGWYSSWAHWFEYQCHTCFQSMYILHCIFFTPCTLKRTSG